MSKSVDGFRESLCGGKRWQKPMEDGLISNSLVEQDCKASAGTPVIELGYNFDCT